MRDVTQYTITIMDDGHDWAMYAKSKNQDSYSYGTKLRRVEAENVLRVLKDTTPDTFLVHMGDYRD